jgi:acyl dehydratase
MRTLEVFVGMELPSLPIEPITRKTLALFAGASGDHQPILTLTLPKPKADPM